MPNTKTMDNDVLVYLIEPPIQLHELERIFDYHEQRTRHHVRKEALVKWEDRPKEGSTWENISVLRKTFPTFVFEDEIASPRGE